MKNAHNTLSAIIAGIFSLDWGLIAKKSIFWGIIVTLLGVVIVSSTEAKAAEAKSMYIPAVSQEEEGYDNLRSAQTTVSFFDDRVFYLSDRVMISGKIRCEFESDCSVRVTTGGAEGYSDYTYNLKNEKNDLIEGYFVSFWFKYNTTPKYLQIEDVYGNILYFNPLVGNTIKEVEKLQKELRKILREERMYKRIFKKYPKLDEIKAEISILEAKEEHVRGLLKLLEIGVEADDFVPEEFRN